MRPTARLPSRGRLRYRVGNEARIDQRYGRTANAPQLDGGHIFEHSATVGEAGRVASQPAQAAGLGLVDGMARLRLNVSACVFPRNVWKLGTMPAGIPVNETLLAEAISRSIADLDLPEI